MQRNNQDHCPCCRSTAVLEADEGTQNMALIYSSTWLMEHAGNLDTVLMEFLRRNFSKEVKAKQKSNEYDAGVDRYGKAYDTKCSIM